MKKRTCILIFLSLFILVLFSCRSLSDSNLIKEEKSEQMENIKFIPKEFHDVKLGYSQGSSNLCSPKFPSGTPINSITINTPSKIIYNTENRDFIFVIPVCAAYQITDRRGYKYSALSRRVLHIKKVGEETIYSGEIVDKDESLIILPPNYDLMVKRHKERVEEAQNYTDEELNESQFSSGGYLNINLMEYVDIPLQTGKYEIYLSFCGLESNHTIVEIVFK
jgi:DNA-binding Lrp family transcriptional regulator